MTRFAADWLDLRESADAAARDTGIARRLALHLGAAARVVDLGCGTGANFRWLEPRLEPARQWTLLDNDPTLLDGIEARLPGGAPAERRRVRWQQHDLARQPLHLDGVDLVTASALLDLVSRAWTTRLVEACARVRCAALFALCYDGRIEMRPHHDLDPAVRDALNRHQGRDKGFGPALGPAAAAAASRLFSGGGWRVSQARSDWRLGPAESALQHALLDGWTQAAAEILPRASHAALEHWHAFRVRQVTHDASQIRVGHVDLLALPPP